MQQAQEVHQQPISLVELDGQYQAIASDPAWLHLMGCLANMRRMYEEAILRGERDRFGNDLTDKARASYGTLLQIMAIPAQISQSRKTAEDFMLGPGPQDELDVALNNRNI